MSEQNTLLFLGSGATAGSGMSPALPADRDFFKAMDLDKDIQPHCPALWVLRKHVSCFTEKIGLFPTWNALFIERSLAFSLSDDSRNFVIEEFPEWLTGGQKRHYECQWEILKAIYGDELEKVKYWKTLGLAIWDLRFLVKKVYDVRGDPEAKGYAQLWKECQNVKAVINLNYDHTFDDFLKGSSANNTPPIIRPHGSLEWTSRNRWICSKEKNGWLYPGPWPSEKTKTQLEDLGYAKSPPTATAKFYEFSQPLIVTPDIFKEEVVGSSTVPGLIDPILRDEWIHLEKNLKGQNIKRWLLVGLSLDSGDDHLIHFLNKYKEGKTIESTCLGVHSGRTYNPCPKMPCKTSLKLKNLGLNGNVIHLGTGSAEDSLTRFEAKNEAIPV